MQVHGPSHIHAAQAIKAPHRQAATPSDPVQPSSETVDQLDISQEAEIASRMHDIPEIRADRVAAIRAEIEAGTYETPEKLDTAVSRLLDEIG